MKTLKNSRDLIRQNEKVAKNPQKHDVNLQKNSTLYFQVGLIVCLFFTLGLFEMKFEVHAQNYMDYPPLEEPDNYNTKHKFLKQASKDFNLDYRIKYSIFQHQINFSLFL